MPPRKPAEIPPIREALQQLVRLMRLIRSYWGALGKGMVLGLVLGMFGMVSPYLSKLLIDKVYVTRDVTLMNVLVLGILAAAVAQAVLGLIRGYFTTYTTSHLGSSTTLLFFNHLQHLRVRFFDEHRVGEIMSRFTDVRSSLASVSRIFETIFVNGAYLVLVPPFLFLLQWKLAVVALVTIPLTSTITMLLVRVVRKLLKRTAEAFADLNAYQMEVLSHIRTMKTLSTEHLVYERAKRQTRDAVTVQLKVAMLRHLFVAIHGTIRAVGTALVTWYGWTLIIRGEMSLGDYIAFTAYVGYLVNPLQQLSGVFSEVQQTAVYLGRMFEYLDMPVEQDPAMAYLAAPAIVHRIAGDIRFQEVSFGYNPASPVLHDVTLHFPRGKWSAVVGPSGAGKSSLLRLITRMEEPTTGRIFIDGVPADEMSIPDVRRQMSVVWQELSLMQGTVWDNLVMGTPGATRKRVEEAVRLCRLDGVIADLPQGYATPVAEWGATLSGGQRQRVALARALIHDSPVLLMDEATSTVDLQTETEILRDLFTELEGKTVIFVTHRVQTAAVADHIVVIEAGRAHSCGTHEELMEGSELYRLLHGGGAVGETRHRHAVTTP
jgi:ABC-type bacteriocin/lantibiotic exporter with double-glycine peptidase domain